MGVLGEDDIFRGKEMLQVETKELGFQPTWPLSLVNARVQRVCGRGLTQLMRFEPDRPFWF